MEEQFEQKMYSLVLYQLKPIHQGIQSQHAITEYAEKYFSDPQYRRWATKDKTTIILNAGGSNELADAIFKLHQNEISYTPFYEPDLFDCPTAVCFLVDERVWNKEKYPEPEPTMNDMLTIFLPQLAKPSDWVEKIGGKKNLFLRLFLANYKRA